uniref:Uncharacterized protein LOC116945813 isoform X8 n=1 Tax=Petromyzon marinus TaxID=7757 RepID=A0AAJ7TG65_PETMA|nr:uncharacterized protein LOC116945813 isoform X8 [Petromyzon marinus]
MPSLSLPILPRLPLLLFLDVLLYLVRSSFFPSSGLAFVGRHSGPASDRATAAAVGAEERLAGEDRARTGRHTATLHHLRESHFIARSSRSAHPFHPLRSLHSHTIPARLPAATARPPSSLLAWAAPLSDGAIRKAHLLGALTSKLSLSLVSKLFYIQDTCHNLLFLSSIRATFVSLRMPQLQGGGGGGRGGRAGGKALGSRGPVWRPGTSLQSACRASSEMCIASSHVEVESRDEKARSLEDTIMELCTARWRPSRPTVRPTPGSSLAGARTPALAAQLQSL